MKKSIIIFLTLIILSCNYETRVDNIFGGIEKDLRQGVNYFSKSYQVLAPLDTLIIPLDKNSLTLFDSFYLGNIQIKNIHEYNDTTSYYIIPDDFIINKHFIWENFSLKGFKQNKAMLLIDSIKIFKGRNYFNNVNVLIKNISILEKDSTWLLDNNNHSFNIINRIIYSDLNFEIELINAYDIEFGVLNDLNYPYDIKVIEDNLKIENITKYQRGTNTLKNAGVAFYITESVELNDFIIKDKKNTNKFIITINSNKLKELNTKIINSEVNIAYQEQTGNTSGGVKFWESFSINENSEIIISLSRK